MAMQAGLKGAYDCVQAFSETDFTEDLRKIDVPARLVKDATLKIYASAPHGLASTSAYKGTFNADLPG